jgi:hypothetical protein
MPALPALLTGPDVELFSDDDLRRLLGNGLLLEGLAAEALCRRGLAAGIGVRAETVDQRGHIVVIGQAVVDEKDLDRLR